MNVRTVPEEWVLTAESRDSAHAPPVWAPRNVQPDPYPPGKSWRALGDCNQSKEKNPKDTDRDVPGGLVVKNLPSNAGDDGWIPGCHNLRFFKLSRATEIKK